MRCPYYYYRDDILPIYYFSATRSKRNLEDVPEVKEVAAYVPVFSTTESPEPIYECSHKEMLLAVSFTLQ